ncbi:molecular chaperone TorD family protein [Oceanisphaera arctica]|uniref:Chaperone protein TorD n=1 Tax=Oceanisphaera arctica TaxID=641510 RepID=A0A2P5TMJ4_9GAMM|nr:molecular chaperone TorD family protein [Oceanisphaera arctica]PPL16654.1 chaperone protein TorD [Oceanisphaera arctica]GHA21058.1 chaperone protein TorD [Oceanisphaera arctica]
MQDFMVTSHRRAELYHWFTALFAAPLVDEEIREFGGYDMHAFLDSLATLDPLQDATEAFRRQAGRVLELDQPESELSEHYQRLFGDDSLLDTASLAQPEDEAMMLMSILLHQHGTRLEDDDPLNACNQLEMMATLALAGADADNETDRIALLDQQRELANQLLIDWLPPFASACEQKDSFGFYAAAAGLLLAMFSMDIHYLNNVAQ